MINFCREICEGISGFLLLATFFLVFTLSVAGIESGIIYLEKRSDERKISEIYKIRNGIEETRVNLAFFQAQLKDQVPPNANEPVTMFQSDYAFYNNLVMKEKRQLTRMIKQHNKWHLRHNGFLIGTETYKKLLI